MPKPVSLPFPVRNPLPINSAFGQRPLYGDFHSGIDFNSTTGAYLNTPVRAAGGGMVVESYDGNDARDGIDSTWAKLRGTMVRINHGDGWWTRYHMLNPATNIKVGTVVAAGDIIGHVGNSGSSGTGAHLHFELWKDGVAVNPVLYLKYDPAAFASTSSGGSTPIDNEERMTPEQELKLNAANAKLDNLIAYLYNGGGDVPGSPGGQGSVLQRLIDVQGAVSATTPKIDNLNRQVTGADGFTPSVASRVIDIQSRVGVTDVKPIVDAVVAAIKANPSAPVDYAAIAKAVNDDAAKRRDAWT